MNKNDEYIIDSLIRDEKDTISDYKDAIRRCNDDKCIEVFEHIIEDEEEHIKELEALKQGKNITDSAQRLKELKFIKKKRLLTDSELQEMCDCDMKVKDASTNFYVQVCNKDGEATKVYEIKAPLEKVAIKKVDGRHSPDGELSVISEKEAKKLEKFKGVDIINSDEVQNPKKYNKVKDESDVARRIRERTKGFTESFSGNIVVEESELEEAKELLNKYYYDVEYIKLHPGDYCYLPHPSGKRINQYEIYGDTLRHKIKDSAGDILNEIMEGANADVPKNIKRVITSKGGKVHSMNVKPDRIVVRWEMNGADCENTINLRESLFRNNCVILAEDIERYAKKRVTDSDPWHEKAQYELTFEDGHKETDSIPEYVKMGYSDEEILDYFQGYYDDKIIKIKQIGWSRD